MFFTSPVSVSVGSEEPMAIDFAIAHLFLPVVREAPLFGFHEITSKVEDDKGAQSTGESTILAM